ncbi:MAG: GMC family oxidoreductase [Gemmatimonadota bacterium]
MTHGADPFDTIVIGSGFGGVMAALPLVMAGERVLMLERGEWVERGPQNWEIGSAHELSEHYCPDAPYRVDDARVPRSGGSFHCVGGPSVFYGGVALRFREEDFAPGAAIVGNSGAEWPFGYAELAPYYDWAESLLAVAGDDRSDPTAPARHAPYPQRPADFTPPAQRVAAAARRLGLNPFPLPLAINYSSSDDRAPCALCCTCDGFACAISAKNDLATGLIPMLQSAGLELRAGTAAVRLTVDGTRVSGVTVVDRRSGRSETLRAARVILAAGTLATPHLLLASGIEQHSTAPDAVGRYLTRHNNLLTLGVFSRRPNPGKQFHKQVAIHDFYFGAPGVDPAIGKLGCIQQITAPGPEFVRRILPPPLGLIAAIGVPHVLGLLAIAEDQPLDSNRLFVDHGTRDALGLPTLHIRHRYTARDVAAGRALVAQSRRILREAGALFSIVHDLRSFSHAVGTVRMGPDERTAPIDERGRFRGLDNLYVADGSVFPTSGGVNPSLTIAANALRIGTLLTGRAAPRGTARAQLPTIERAAHAP